MAKKNEQIDVVAEQEIIATPNFNKWKEGIMKNNPDLTEDSDMEDFYAASSAGYDAEHDYAKKEREDLEKIHAIFAEHPELANFMDSVLNAEGNDLGEAIFNLGELITGYATGEIDSAAYKRAVDSKKKQEKEIEEKSAIQAAAFEDACKEMGVDPNETAQELMQKLFNPMSAYELTTEVWKNLINMLSYDDDVAAAEIKGRNANIVAQRKKVKDSTDGIPHANSTTAIAREKEKTPIDLIVERRMARKKL